MSTFVFSLVIRFSLGERNESVRDPMTQIIPLSFLIHRKYVHSLNWEVPFLAVLCSTLPLWKWPILLLSMIFRCGPSSLCCSKVLEQFLSMQSNGSSTIFRSFDQLNTSGAHIRQLSWHKASIQSILWPREDHSLLGPSLFFWTIWKMQNAHV